MPAAYVGAATALAGAVSSATSDSGGGASGGSSSGSGGGGANAMLAGGLANSLNPLQSQTLPGSYSPPSNSGQGYNYIPTGQGGIDQLIQQILQNTGQRNFGTAVSDPGQLALSNPYQVDFSPGSATSNLSNAMTQQYGPAIQGAGMNLVQQAGSYYPMLQQIYQASADPQGALYNRTAGLLQDQVRAGQAARGLALTPYAAGGEGKAMSDFNIDWNNQQLQRLISGSGAVTSGLQGIGNAQTTGANLTNTGIDIQNRGQLLPHDIFNKLQTDYLNTTGKAAGLDLASAGPALQYLSTAQGANKLAQQSAYQDAVLKGNQNANAAAGISSGLNNIMPWIGQGLNGLYNSIFPGSSPSDTNSATGNSWATDAAPGPNQVEPM